MLAPVWKLSQVIEAMRSSHPYEEIAYDIYPLRYDNSEYGLGVLGDLAHPLPAEMFLALAGRRLQLKNFRFTKGPETISRVALCGGAGSELLQKAISKKADAFITGDVKYHSFQDAAEKILYIDAGHFETELHIVPALASQLQHWLRSKKSKIKVFTSQTMANPVHYYHD
jgi:putative NIF3 family GTP cyclohydrolase 1 type 2